MEIKPTTIRTLSMLGQRGAFGMALLECASREERIVALSADLCNTSGLDRFRAAFPDRFFNIGIAEQNMVGVAAGLAAEGRVPVATTFTNFAVLRACEQVRHFMGYMRENIKLVGFGAGFSFGMFGTTHYGVEDVAVIRAIPNVVIISPADGLSVVKAVEAMVSYDGPVYLRLTGGMNNPIVYKQDIDFQIGKAISVYDGDDVAILASGSMVSTALRVREKLLADGISAAVMDFHTIKPLDCESIEKVCSKRMIVTMEEHSKIGGLGAAVAECLSRSPHHPQQLIFGSEDEYLHAGSPGYMLKAHGLEAESISVQIKAVLHG